MRLLSLSQLNFRNLLTPRLEFGSGINAVVGDNAAGKSNVLAAAYLASSGELPGGKIVESVRLGETEGFVSARIERKDGISTVEVGLSPGKKVVRLDGQFVRAAEVARVASSVLITPEDADIVHGSPSGRRAYLDSLLSKLSLRYALRLREYNRVVEQRNAVLKQAVPDATLDVWTRKFLDLGAEIVDLRKRAVNRIAELAAESYADIAGDRKHLEISLSPSYRDSDLEDRLKASGGEERARGITVVGPHRDDLNLRLGGHSIQAYGSRGEARTTALALRVAEYRLLLEKHEEAPILLLDDFSAELDANRREFLLKLAAQTPQAIVSGTEAPPEADSSFRVVEGTLHGV